MELLRITLWKAGILLLCCASTAGVLLAIGLLLDHERVVRLNSRLSRWISGSRVAEPLDRPRWIERVFYRHHRLTGSALLIGASAVLYVFLFRYNSRKIAPFIPSAYLSAIDSVIALALVSSTVGAMVAIIVLVRPSLLREIERIANRWVDSGGMVTFFDTMHLSVDRSVIRNRRIGGLLLLAASVFVLHNMAPLLW